MSKWKICNLNNNTYMLEYHNSFIKFKVNHSFSKNVEVNIENKNMSKDNIIFMTQLYPSENSDLFIIGKAYMYKDSICIEESLIDVELIDSNILNPIDILYDLLL